MYSFLSTQQFMKFILLLPLLLIANQTYEITLASHDLTSKIEIKSPHLGESANFELTKTVSSSTAQPGDTLTYEIILTTINEAITISLTDTLPVGLTYLADTVTGGATFTNGEIRYTGTVAPDSPLTISYQVTVDMNIASGSILYNAVEATGAEMTGEAAVTVSIPDSQQAQTLVLLYVNGDNDLSDYMLNLVNRAEEGASHANLTVLLLLDGPSEGDTYLYRLQEDHDGSCPNYNNLTCDGRYVLGQNLWQWRENVASPYSLAEFLIGAQQAYPQASQIVLSLVGHGGGWAPTVLAGLPYVGHGGQGDKKGGLLWDNQPGSSLSTAELGQALTWFYEATGRKIDLLYLDACLMAMSEVAYEVRDSVDYLLASESWSWTAFRYDEHLEDIGPSSNARQIGEAWLENEANVLRLDDYPFTFSLLDMSQMSTLREAQDQLAEELMAALPDGKRQIDLAFEQSACFDSNADHYIVQPNSKTPAGLPLDNYCDLDSFAREIEGQFSDQPEIVAAAQALRGAIAQVVLLKDHHNSTPWGYSSQLWSWEQLGGISSYLPLIEDDWRRRYYSADQLQSADDGRWDEFLAIYWNNAEPPADPECPIEGCDLPPGPIPTVPIHVRARAGENTINLNWTLEGSLSGELNRYQLWRNTDGGSYSTIASTLNTQYIDNDAALTAGIDYCYQIQALDSANHVIGVSNIICAEFGALTLWIEDEIIAPNKTNVLVPINLANGNDLCIGAMDITISYNSSIVTATGTVSPTIYTEGYDFIANTTQPGQVKIASITSPGECQELYGAGSLFIIGFDVIGSENEISPLNFITGLTGTVIYDYENLDTPINLALSDGLLTVGDTFVRGDINGDGVVNSADAARALQIATGLYIPTTQQIASCDVNGNDSCDQADATLILCYAAFQNWDLCGGSQSNRRLLDIPQNGLVEVAITPTTSQTEQTFSALVVITNALDFSGGHFILNYNASRMVPTNVSLTSLTNDFFMATNRQQPGILTVAIASKEPIVTDGAILEIEFKRLNGTSNIDFASVYLNDATGRDFESSVLQRDIQLVPFTGGSISIFLPTIIR